MIMEGEAAILLETTRRALGIQSQSKQRSTLVLHFALGHFSSFGWLNKRLNLIQNQNKDLWKRFETQTSSVTVLEFVNSPLCVLLC